MSDQIGILIAEKVADHLKEGNVLGYSHRDYCGMGLQYSGGKYLYGKLWDGYMEKAEEEFSDRNEFVNWLSAQDDESLSGQDEMNHLVGNQRITKNRLISFINSKSPL